MSTPLAKQLSARMQAKNLSSIALEREAGLKPSSVQNILRGRSTKPSAEILQAVSNVLGCTVKDLLENQEMFQNTELSEPKKDSLKNKYECSDLLMETAKVVNDALKGKDHVLTIEQVFSCIEKIYLHSLKKSATHVDKNFAEWWIGLATD